jgi:L-histidine Nalpha-methyltransferase
MITLNGPIAAAERATAQFAADVRKGLLKEGQKSIPSVYLYDELGSALFEAITKLPEYGLTRADERLLTAHAKSIARRLPKPGPSHVAELGSGSGRKTRPLLQALHSLSHELVYYPIDVSRSSLEACKSELSQVVPVSPIEAQYLDGLMQVSLRRSEGERLLLLFLGSTIGNFAPDQAGHFLASVREALIPGDTLLLGADLVKPERMIIDAYDDPTLVSSAFTLNLLGRINRELGGNFDLRAFRHVAIYNADAQRVEIYAESLRAQTVRIRAIEEGSHGTEIRIEEGERILTEYSHKYTMQDLRELAAQSGFEPVDAWVDHEWPFAESLWRVPA